MAEERISELEAISTETSKREKQTEKNSRKKKGIEWGKELRTKNYRATT